MQKQSLTMSATDLESKSPVTGGPEDTRPDQGVLREKNLEFTTEYGGNGSGPSYQEISGAPVEHSSPLGYNVGWFTIIFLNIGQMIGTGVFSTRASILPLLSPLSEADVCIEMEKLTEHLQRTQRALS